MRTPNDSPFDAVIGRFPTAVHPEQLPTERAPAEQDPVLFDAAAVNAHQRPHRRPVFLAFKEPPCH